MAKYEYREAKTGGSKGKTLHHLEVKEGEDGGHIVTHHYAEDGMVYHKPKDYAFGADEGADVMKHIAKHMNVDVREKEPEAEAEMEEA